MFLYEVFSELYELELVASQLDFSTKFLKKTPRYYSSIAAQKREPSLAVLFNLKNCLVQYFEMFSRLNLPVHANQIRVLKRLISQVEHEIQKATTTDFC